MPDDPTPDDTERSIDDAEADFLDDRPIEEYPAVLRITAESDEAHRRDVLDRIERWEAGEEVPHVVNFQNPSDLRALLTDRRVELLQSVMSDRPDSIRDLADRLDRDVKTVHDDLSVLAEYDVVHFERDGRAKRPVVPYETIEVRLAIEPPDAADDLAPA